jgi:NADH-quinone oxidoreductase subunit M
MTNDSWSPYILTFVTFAPLVGGLLLMVFPRRDRDIRIFALVFSLLTFLLSLHLPVHFHRGLVGFQYEIDRAWISTPNIHYHMGMDGISLWLVVLTTFLTPLCVLISWHSVHDRVKEFFILLLIMETALIGVFTSLDLFLFYFFWEATLIPMALLIGVFGHERKVYAAVKFFMYTMIASVFMLAAILWLYAHTGTFDFVVIRDQIARGTLPSFPAAAQWLFLGFFLAFAVKVPLFPFHTWLPDAHVEAPTAGSVLLAGVLLKMGTYGMLRFNLGLFPEQARHNAPWIMTLALIGIIYGALVAMVQPNLKKLVAYSSVSHLGFCTLGIFALTPNGLSGSVIQQINHGLSTGALFLIIGVLYERRHTRLISEFGGLSTPMPNFAAIYMIATLSSLGLPLLNGFIGEFVILRGTYEVNIKYVAWAVIGIILGAAYLLWLYQRVMFGPVTNPANEHLADLNAREYATLVPLIILCFWIGIYPKPLFRVLERPVQQIVEQINPGYYGAQRAAAPALQPAPAAAGVDTQMPGMTMPSDAGAAPAPETEKK